VHNLRPTNNFYAARGRFSKSVFIKIPLSAPPLPRLYNTGPVAKFGMPIRPAEGKRLCTSDIEGLEAHRQNDNLYPLHTSRCGRLRKAQKKEWHASRAMYVARLECHCFALLCPSSRIEKYQIKDLLGYYTIRSTRRLPELYKTDVCIHMYGKDPNMK
jgi:hypothetical protein